MQNLALSWQQAAEVAVVLVGAAVVLRMASHRRIRAAAPFALEAAVIAALYALWQRAGALSVLGTDGAYARARWIERFEHDIRLPSERSVQDLVVGHSWLVEPINLYYAAMHFTGLAIFLVWLFTRHRADYARVRTVLVLMTFACLLIQLLPVAPPRMLPGFVDTAMQYGQSVYAGGFAPDELSAMPSVHVGWAVLIAWYCWRLTTNRWRWLGVAHAVLTVFVVVSTANHWWLDGIVAVAVLVVCAWLTAGLFAAWHAVRERVGEEPLIETSELA